MIVPMLPATRRIPWAKPAKQEYNNDCTNATCYTPYSLGQTWTAECTHIVQKGSKYSNLKKNFGQVFLL